MKKIVINYLQRGEYSHMIYTDVVKTAKKCGYEFYQQSIDIYDVFSKGKDDTITKLRYNLIKIPIFIKSLIQIPNNTKILLIYPHPFGIFLPLFFYFLKLKGCNITLMCIDIDSLRGLSKSMSKDVNNLNSVNKIILHTPNMLAKCREIGIETLSELVYMFDYITNDSAPETNGGDGFRIAYAGTLTRSKVPFVSQLEKLNCKKINFLLYGTPDCDLKTNDWIEYKGRFSPEKISEVHGDWGLVWDGYLDRKNDDNMFSEYQRLNYPYKTSLYIASHMPVIVWKEAGIASFIEENHLGITINSLFELEDKIISISKEEKEIMRENVRKFAKKIKNGEMVASVLKRID